MQYIPYEFTEIKNTVLSINDSATAIVAASESVISNARSGRSCVLVKNTSDKTIYYGGDKSISHTNGMPILAGESILFPTRMPQSIYLISNSDTQLNIHIAEFFD